MDEDILKKVKCSMVHQSLVGKALKRQIWFWCQIPIPPLSILFFRGDDSCCDLWRYRAINHARLWPWPTLNRATCWRIPKINRYRWYRILWSRPEFFVFDDVKWSIDMSGARHPSQLMKPLGQPIKKWKAVTMRTVHASKAVYFPVPPVDSSQDMRADMCAAVEAIMGEGRVGPSPWSCLLPARNRCII